MNIDVYAICYNEEKLLPFFIKHYQKFARNIFIFDNHSTDRSREIARRLGATVIEFGNEQLDDREYLKIKNSVYKKSNADYVVVCDLDEFLYHENIKSYLITLKSQGVSLPMIEGYNIYSEDFPQEDILEIKTGFYDLNFSKQIIFAPQIDIRFSYGAHTNAARGRRGGKLYLLHYRCIGGVKEMIDRHRMYADRMCAFNRVKRLGGHYFRSPEQLKIEWSNNINKAKNLVFLNHD